jgi:hypothetical protein
MEASYMDGISKDKVQTWLLYAFWIVLNAFGWVLSRLLSTATSQVVTGLCLGEKNACVSAIFAAGVVGIVLGFAQWIVLRRFYLRSTMWIAATAVGLSLGYCISYKIMMRFSVLSHQVETLPWILEYRLLVPLSSCTGWGTELLIHGLVLGIAQYVVLREWVQHAGLWILSTAACYTLAFPFGCMATEMFTTRQVTTLFTLFAAPMVGGFIFGIGTGAMLIFLLRTQYFTVQEV